MSQNAHPARSPDFLSRLHDGELSPGERAHFESHRAHCAECRAAAAQFEAALSLFRSSRPAPPAPDLSARILRKLQASGRPRPFFGATFGIDLRWAGAFAAALIAAIVGTSIVAKNEAQNNAASRNAPIPVILEKKRPEVPAAAPEIPVRAESRPARKLQGETRSKNVFQEEAQSGAIRARESDKARDSLEANARPSAAAKEKRNDAPREMLAESARSEAPAAPAIAMKSAAPASPPAAAERGDAAAAQLAARPPERAGGEVSAGAALEGTRSPVRLIVRSLDGALSAPELLPAPAAEVPANLRGRAYILFVDAAGRVRQARAHPPPSKDELSGDPRAADPPSLLALRFAPGDRPRRLLLRIE